ATPPPRAVELTCQITLPVSRRRAVSIAESTSSYASPSRARKRSGGSAATGTSCSAPIAPHPNPRRNRANRLKAVRQMPDSSGMAAEVRRERVVLETEHYRIVGEVTLPVEGFHNRLSD